MSKTLTNQINRAIAEHMATGHGRHRTDLFTAYISRCANLDQMR